MRIKKIRLKNSYKRFFDLTIDLGETPARIVALVGPNGSGKSSVFDGMIYKNTGHHGLGSKGDRGPGFHSMKKVTNFDRENVIIDFDTGDFIKVIKEKFADQKGGTLFSYRSPYRYNNHVMISQSKAVKPIGENNYGASTSIDIDDKMEENYRRLNIKLNKYIQDNDVRPSEGKTKIIGDLNNAIRNCLDLEIDNLGNIEAGEGTMYFTKHDQKTPFEFNVLSSGEKEVIDMLLDLYLRQEDFDKSIFIIDEPELHINTSIQKKLLIEINKLIGPNCQIWIATHSIGFLRALQNELKHECQIVRFDANPKRGTEVEVLHPMTKNRANWVKIFETALDDLTGLISPRKIVYCEGKDSPGLGGLEKGFDAKVYNTIFGEHYEDTLFISSGGNTELDQRSQIALAILTKVFPDLEILVLKDRDISSGRMNSEADRRIYLSNNPTNHRVLKRWEIENYLYDKHVLQKYCTEQGLTFNEGEYDKLVTDIDSQNVKDETGKIKNFCGIKTNVTPENFKVTLANVITPDMDVYKELEEVIFKRK